MAEIVLRARPRRPGRGRRGEEMDGQCSFPPSICLLLVIGRVLALL